MDIDETKFKPQDTQELQRLRKIASARNIHLFAGGPDGEIAKQQMKRDSGGGWMVPQWDPNAGDTVINEFRFVEEAAADAAVKWLKALAG